MVRRGDSTPPSVFPVPHPEVALPGRPVALLLLLLWSACAAAAAPPSALDVATADGWTATACGEAGVRLRAPDGRERLVPGADLPGPALAVAFAGGSLYVGAGEHLTVVTTHRPAPPRSLDVGAAVRRLAVRGSRLVAALDAGGLLVLDLSAPEPLLTAAVVTTAWPAWDVAVSADGAVAWAATAAGVAIVELHADAPRLRGTLVAGGPALSLAAAADRLWVGMDDGRLLVCDVSDPASPRELRRLRLPAPAVELCTLGDRLYMLGSDGRLRASERVPGEGLLPLPPLDAPPGLRAVAAADGLVAVAAAGASPRILSDAAPPPMLPFPVVHAPTRLLGTLPNPYDTGATVLYRLARSERVRLSIHDALGREAAVLLDEPRDAGTHSVAWDGRLADGWGRAPGVWYLRLEAGGSVDVRSFPLF